MSFLRRSVDRREDPARNRIALDLGKPHLHLLEQGGVGRGEVEYSKPCRSMRPGDNGNTRLAKQGTVQATEII